MLTRWLYCRVKDGDGERPLDVSAYDGLITTLELVTTIDTPAGVIRPEHEVLKHCHPKWVAHILFTNRKC